MNTTTSGTIILTSTGFRSPSVCNKFLEIAGNKDNKKVAIITTAAYEKENHKYSQLALSQFQAMGFLDIDFYDFENEPNKDLSRYDIIYVCGGNSFKLLKFAKESNFKDSINNLLNKGGIYVGVSAGSIILSPSIKIAGEIRPDPNDVGLTGLEGFSIIDFILMPHYSSELEQEIVDFERREQTTVERITNDEAITIHNGVATKR